MIELCLRPERERPSANELLEHSFAKDGALPALPPAPNMKHRSCPAIPPSPRPSPFPRPANPRRAQGINGGGMELKVR